MIIMIIIMTMMMKISCMHFIDIVMMMRRIMFRVDVNLLYALHRSGLSSSTARLATLADVEKVSCWLRMMIDD